MDDPKHIIESSHQSVDEEDLLNGVHAVCSCPLSFPSLVYSMASRSRVQLGLCCVQLELGCVQLGLCCVQLGLGCVLLGLGCVQLLKTLA